MLDKLTGWLLQLVTEALSALVSWLKDLAVWAVEAAFGAVAAVLSAIPVPDITGGGMSALWGGLDSGILWVASAVGIPQALAMFGAAYSFRLARKVATLFQW